MDKKFLAILAGIVIILGGIFVVAKNSDSGTSGDSDSNAQPTNHIDGQGQAGVTLMEYGDFQCSVCAIYYSPLKQVTKIYQKEIYFQFRNLPLTSIHQNAFAAARAAEAADKQGKYWEMYSKLYENQAAWSGSSSALSLFKGYAKAIGLDEAKFEKDYASEEINDAINADVAAFGKTGRPQSTPSFFINGKPVDNSEMTDSSGAPSVEVMSALIDKAIAQQQKNQ